MRFLLPFLNYSLESICQTFFPRELTLWSLQMYVRTPQYGCSRSALHAGASSCRHFLLDANGTVQAPIIVASVNAAATVLLAVVAQSSTCPFDCICASKACRFIRMGIWHEDSAMRVQTSFLYPNGTTYGDK